MAWKILCEGRKELLNKLKEGRVKRCLRDADVFTPLTHTLYYALRSKCADRETEMWGRKWMSDVSRNTHTHTHTRKTHKNLPVATCEKGAKKSRFPPLLSQIMTDFRGWFSGFNSKLKRVEDLKFHFCIQFFCTGALKKRGHTQKL